MLFLFNYNNKYKIIIIKRPKRRPLNEYFEDNQEEVDSKYWLLFNLIINQKLQISKDSSSSLLLLLLNKQTNNKKKKIIIYKALYY